MKRIDGCCHNFLHYGINDNRKQNGPWGGEGYFDPSMINQVQPHPTPQGHICYCRSYVALWQYVWCGLVFHSISCVTLPYKAHTDVVSLCCCSLPSDSDKQTCSEIEAPKPRMEEEKHPEEIKESQAKIAYNRKVLHIIKLSYI